MLSGVGGVGGERSGETVDHQPVKHSLRQERPSHIVWPANRLSAEWNLLGIGRVN